jgi:prepilin-type N-terminal cleavage/methylation domain-containing protein
MRFLKKKSPAFTLVELMVATFILGVALVGLLGSYISCLDLNDLSKNTSLAINIAQTKLEEIKNHTYTLIKNDYNAIPFNISGLAGMGVSYIDDSNPDLLLVTVTVCWRQQNRRIIGEDANLNGQLDAGEDSNLNTRLDSIAQVVTYIAKH